MTLASTDIPIWVVWFRDEKKDKKLEFQGKEIGPDQEGGWVGIQRNWRERLGKGMLVGNYPGRGRRLCGPPSPHSDPQHCSTGQDGTEGITNYWKVCRSNGRKKKIEAGSSQFQQGDIRGTGLRLLSIHF